MTLDHLPAGKRLTRIPLAGIPLACTSRALLPLLALFTLSLTACSSPPEPPQPEGPRVAINSEQLQQELNQGLISQH